MHTDENVVLYVRDNCKVCDAVINQLKRWQVKYDLRNISQCRGYLKEMQKQGYYGAPVTFVNGLNKAIIGFNRSALRLILRLESKTHFRNRLLLYRNGTIFR